MSITDIVDEKCNEQLNEFITRWKASGGAERANYQLFLCELCGLLGVPSSER